MTAPGLSAVVPGPAIKRPLQAPATTCRGESGVDLGASDMVRIVGKHLQSRAEHDFLLNYFKSLSSNSAQFFICVYAARQHSQTRYEGDQPL